MDDCRADFKQRSLSAEAQNDLNPTGQRRRSDMYFLQGSGPSRKVFVAYSHRDGRVVDGCVRLLVTGGAHVFKDDLVIPAGVTWRGFIADAIEDADVILVFWSKAAQRSTEVRLEYEAGIAQRKRVAPVILDDTPLPRELAEFQAIDIRAQVPKRRVALLSGEPQTRALAKRWVSIPVLDRADDAAALPAAVVVKAALARLLAEDHGPPFKDPIDDPGWRAQLEQFKDGLEIDEPGWLEYFFRRYGTGLLLIAGGGAVALIAFVAFTLGKNLTVKRLLGAGWLPPSAPEPVKSSSSPARLSLIINRRGTAVEAAKVRLAGDWCLVDGDRVLSCKDNCIVPSETSARCQPRPTEIVCGTPKARNGATPSAASDPAMEAPLSCYLSRAICEFMSTSCQVLDRPADWRPIPSGPLSKEALATIEARRFDEWCRVDGRAMNCGYSYLVDCRKAIMSGEHCVKRPSSIACGYDRDHVLEEPVVRCFEDQTDCKNRAAAPNSCQELPAPGRSE